MGATIQKATARRKRPTKVPEYLIKEVIGGRPFYYKGYRQVLDGAKTIEDIRGCSGLQAVIIEYLLLSVCVLLDRKKYRIFTNELGNHLSKKNNLSYDIAIFDKSVLVPEKITRRYVDVTPEIVIEIDIDVELKGTDIETTEDFIFIKTTKVFEFGAKKLIWILSRSKKVIIAEKEKTWQIVDWNHDVELLPEVTFNVANYLAEEGISTEE